MASRPDDLDDALLKLLSEVAAGDDSDQAPTRLKSRIYSSLIAAQQETGPLRALSQTESAGHGLCVFEQLVNVAPVPEKAKEPFFCRVCHARIAGERIEHAFIFWQACPYSNFQR